MGVYDWDDGLGGEFNGRGPFLRGLNEGESEVTPGTAFLTLRSDGMDKYAQADGRFGRQAGHADRGLPRTARHSRAPPIWCSAPLDHRETAYHPRAFREIYKFIAGREPERIAIVPEAEVRLSGLVTARPEAFKPIARVAGAAVEIFRVSPDSGERIGGAIHSSQTGADGRWGPAQVDSSWYLEMILIAPGSTTTHFYRSPFPRSSDVVHLRSARAVAPPKPQARWSSCRGRAGISACPAMVLLDGKEPTDVKAGVPTDSITTARLAEAGRAVVGIFNPGAYCRTRLAGVGKPDFDRRTDAISQIRGRLPYGAAIPNLYGVLTPPRSFLRIARPQVSIAKPTTSRRHGTAGARKFRRREDHEPVPADGGDAKKRHRYVGAAFVRRGRHPDALFRPQQFHRQRAGCDPAWVLVGQLRELRSHPCRHPVLKPMMGDGLLIAEGRTWKHQRRTLAPAFTPRAVNMLVPHDRGDRMRRLRNYRPFPAQRWICARRCTRMTLEIAGAPCSRSGWTAMVRRCAIS